MIGRIVEIAGDGRYLSLDRGFLVVSHHGDEMGRTALWPERREHRPERRVGA